MNLRIEEINLQNIGPIAEFKMSLGDINLVYGKNEQGKTCLVEFILRTLFKQAKDFGLRSNMGDDGRILLSGITPNERTSFTIGSPKLEELLSKPLPGLPPKISRLLVVKGAELGLRGPGAGNLDMSVVKEYLSNTQVLDTIHGQISATLQSASLEGYQISGRQSGEIKKQGEALSKIEEIEALYQSLSDSYSVGRISALINQQASIEEKIATQHHARRHLAFQLSEQITNLDNEINRIPEANLTKIEELLVSYRIKAADVENDHQKIVAKQNNCNDYQWLENALTFYQQRSVTQPANMKGRISYIVILVFLMVFAIASSFLNYPIMTALFVLSGLILGGILIRKLSAYTVNIVEIEEANRIASEFEERFGKPMKNMAQMKTMLDELRNDYYESQALHKQLTELKNGLESLSAEITRKLCQFSDETPTSDNWNKLLAAIEQKRQQFIDEQNQKKLDRAKLNIAEEEYLSEPAALEYDENALKALEREDLEMQEEIKAEQYKNEEMVASIRRITRTKREDLDWESLLEKLQEERSESLTEFQQLKAECVAKIILNDILSKEYQREEKNIQAWLQDSAVRDPLFHVTQRYKEVLLDDHSLTLVDDFHHYPFSCLSTGTQEQILLALRIGFAAKILNKEKMFLILDDAFQHSDWDRREQLIDQVIRIAQSGWQIIYFTMDDHIRHLFNKKLQHGFEGSYQYKELTAKGSRS
jgi:hypothetical protein